MLNYEIDHLFQLVESEEIALKLANATGLNVYSKTDHKGQGTSGLFLIFEKCYFEFIWLRDIDEAKNNPLRFDKKIEAWKNGGSPFGVALKAGITDDNDYLLGVDSYTRYCPEYGPYTIFLFNETFRNPTLPLFFVMAHPERPKNSDWNPYKQGAPKNKLCNFESDIKYFSKVKIFGPNLNLDSFPCVELIKSETHSMEIEAGVDTYFSDLVKLY